MNKIYVTGDTHTEWVRRLNGKNFPEGKRLTEEDYIIICGDLGIWNDSTEENHNLDWLDKSEIYHKHATVLFVEGNHDNYDLLKRYPVEEWHGGKVQFIRSKVIHLMRGQVYEIAGKKIFTFGGASCHDIEEGILDPADANFERKKRFLDIRNRKRYRIKGKTWWPEELPTEEEMQEGLKNLKKHGNKVDYIITHCIYDSLRERIDGGSGEYKQDILTEYLQKIKNTTEYEQWYFGHYHINQKFPEEKATCLLEKIESIH